MVPLNREMTTLIEIRPHRGGWQCYEGKGVAPYFIEADAKGSAIDYATNRMKGRTGEICVYDAAGAIERTIAFDGCR